ncbi:MAG: DNA modification methylase [Desulfobulbaceae bacterium]|jgi:DNA modification methylase|nr:DNA modification methylase [Desulfobulbaceae bacterium]
MKIESWATHRLVPYAFNLRKNDGAVDRMAAALREFGFRVPLLVRSSGEIIDGHLRLKAAIVLGMSEVPVLLADDLTPAQVRAFRLLVNRSATWASWDEELLAKEIAALLAANFDITLTGFDQHEIDKLLKAENGQDPDAIPNPPAQPLVRPGDIWLLGAHRLYCGDATRLSDRNCLLSGWIKADMVWTDPPYNVDYEGQAGKITGDKMTAAQFDDFLFSAMAGMFAALKPGGAIYIAHAESIGNGLAFRHAFHDAGFRFASCLIWNKGQAVFGRSDYHWQHEPILYGWKPGAAHKWHGNRQPKTILEAGLPGIAAQDDGSFTLLIDGKLYRLSGDNLQIEETPGTVINIPKPTKSELHPTTKPVDLVAHCISNSSASGDIVFDPFGGSGSTLIACERLGRRCFSLEIDPRFVQVQIERWQDFVGGKAVRESDGMLFDELKL